MKKCLLIAAFITSMNAFSQSVSSSNNDEINTLETIVCITHNDPVVVESVKGAMTSMAGTNVIAYCDNHAVFMVVIDKNVYHDADTFLNQVRKYAPNAASLLTLKQGGFDNIKKQCEPSNSKDASKLKTLFTN